jgi:potassium efflux system protein
MRAVVRFARDAWADLSRAFPTGTCPTPKWLTGVVVWLAFYSLTQLSPTATHAGAMPLFGRVAHTSIQDETPTTNRPPTTAPTPLPTSAPRPTQDELKAELDAAMEAGLDEDSKKKIQEWYKSAAEQLTRLDAIPARVTDFQQRIATADQRADQWRETSQLSVEPARFNLETSSLAEMQKEATDTDTQLRQWKERVAVLDAEREAMAERRRELTSRISATPERLAEARLQLQAPTPEGEAPTVTKARRTATLVQLSLWEAELPALTLERDYIDGETSRDILRLERDWLTARIDLESRWLQQVNETINRKRADEARVALEQAEQQRATVPIPLQTLADEIKDLAVEQASLSETMSAQQTQRDSIALQLKALREKFESTQKKVKTVGLTSTIGYLLRRQRSDIPTAVELRRLQLAPGQIGEVQLQLLQIDEQRGELILYDELARVMLNLGNEPRDWSPDERLLFQQATEMLKAKREALDSLHRNLDTYFNTLVEVDTDVHQLIEVAQNYRGYIDQRILWIPSSRPLFRYFEWETLDRWLFQADLWQQLGQIVLQDFLGQWLWWIFFGTLWFSMKLQGYRWRAELHRLGREASSGTCASFWPTLRALVFTALISIPWPMLLYFFGWRIESVVSDLATVLKNHAELQGVGRGLSLAALGLLPLECLRNICRDSGLGASHFGWNAETLHRGARLVRLVIFIGLPLVFITTALHWVDPVLGEDLLERLCFLVGCGMLLYLAFSVLEPQRGLLRGYYAKNSGGWAERLCYVWFGLGVGAPVLLAALTTTGYYYSAYQLSVRMYSMFWLVVALIVGRELISRLILVERRRVFIDQAKQRRAQVAASASPEVKEDADVAVAAALHSQKDWQEKLAQQTKQSQNLLNSVGVMLVIIGVWFMWADVVPALRVVLQQNLWTTVETVSTTNESGSTEEPITKEVVRQITPTDLLQAMIVLLMTFVVFRNLPGLIDILVLNQLPIDASTRNAAAAVSSYLVIVIGLIWSARLVGVHWTQVQWLVTALTFGLAFGLQEIFANFVSGIIILFERPVRVGDVVTVDGVTGVVTRTRARATMIRDFDLKELIVPNKEFITGRVLNWTLSDEVTRLVLPVGIAYGSDVEQTIRLLLTVVQQHPSVLTEPAPSVTFEAFAESSLNLIVRVYVAKLGDRLPVTSELLTSFYRTLAEHQIEIPFPQRDLHIRSITAQWPEKPKESTTGSKEQ